MYTSFFGLAEKPFAITPDPRYLYLSERHAEALAHLLYGIGEAGGFVQLTGEVGTGKTTTIRSLLAQVPAHADVALILNPRVTPLEFLLAICDELHVTVPAEARDSVKALVDLLNAYLLDAHARGRRVVVIVDEAQQLSTETLEQVRLLTNLETETRKLLQIILVGQPELRELLARNDLRQLAQRITGRYHLDPLSRSEAADYVRHRLKVAGATSEIFTPGALAELHRISHGIPRIINVIADRALLGAYTRDDHRVTPTLVRHAAREVFGKRIAPPWLGWALGATAVVGAAMLAVGVWYAVSSGRLGGGDDVVADARTPADRAAAERDPVNDGAGGRGLAANAAAPAASGATPGDAVAASPIGAPGAAAPASAGAAPAPPANVAAFLAANGAQTGTDQAFARLFTIWRAPFDAAGPRPCEQASAQGLECLAQKGTLAQLRMLNRPAILALVDASGTEHQVVVSQLGEATARLEVGGAAMDANLLDLQRWWYGDFLILWRPPLPMARTLTPGMRGDEVRWLRQGLRAIRGEPARTGGSDVYDRELVQLVQDFQRAHRLTVDGIAGTQTQVMIDALLGSPGAPTLRASGG